ncbi:hypothetical protein [Brachybacterium sp. UNK5269]|uniref:hypothetical protein n=1 Tax=Brachybacterium sp. UNK5269 TaxID=3408576 RepID=UPI003BB1E12B
MANPAPVEVEVTLHGVVLDPGGAWHREAPRPPASRQERYDERFDTDTLFYDVFRVDEHVELIGPPLLNLAGGLRPMSLQHAGRRYARSFRSTAMNRVHRHRITGIPQDVDSLRLRCPLGRFRLDIGENLSGAFTERRVLVTQSQNNSLEWIARWVDHHVATQGIDAVVFYDNASTLYSSDDVRGVLRDRPGLAMFSVIDWPYPWGPTGGPDSVWDSDFGQLGAWEHAWRRLCRTAATITFGDIDELIIGPEPTVTERAAASPQGICSYRRMSIVNVPAEPTDGLSRMRDYADYRLYDPEAPLLTPKYTVAPGTLLETDQLLVHCVDGRRVPDETDVLVRHFNSMRIEWRDGEQHPVPDLRAEHVEAQSLCVDEELVASLARIPGP